MARPSKIVALDLEHVVLERRDAGDSLEQIREHANEVLSLRGKGEQISKAAVDRYLASLARESVAPAHRPQLAEANATFALDFAGRLRELDQTLNDWLGEVVEATVTVMVGYGDQATFETKPDWTARVGVAKEIRGLLKDYADVQDRILRALDVRTFQQTVMAAIERADPATAREIVGELGKVRDARKAAMFGLEA